MLVEVVHTYMRMGGSCQRRWKVDSVAVQEGNCRIAGAKDYIYNALEISDED